MSTPQSVVDMQLQHLLEVVDHERDKRCRKLLEVAEQEARDIVRRAYREARAHAHDDLEKLRENMRQRAASASARQQTQLRQLRQQADQTFLDAAWKQLQQALQQHWQYAGQRQEWVTQLVDAAAATLLGKDWLIEHPQNWPDAEGDALVSRLLAARVCTPRLAPCPVISAGLRISADGACVDGSIEGLLWQRKRIEAQLLAEIRKRQTPAE